MKVPDFRTSRGLNRWADAMIVIGVVGAIILLISGEFETALYVLAIGFVTSPIYRGLSVIVHDSERNLYEKDDPWCVREEKEKKPRKEDSASE